MSGNAEQHDMARSDRLQRAAAADAARDGVVANTGAALHARVLSVFLVCLGMGVMVRTCPSVSKHDIQLGLVAGFASCSP